MVNWSVLEALMAEVGEEDFGEIAGFFLSEIEDALEDLPRIPAGPALSDALHGLKGSALNLGFDQVAELCAKGEADPTGFAVSPLENAVATSLQACRTKFPQFA